MTISQLKIVNKTIILCYCFFIPVLLPCVPFYFLSKYLEKAIKPKQTGKQFLFWLSAVSASAFGYFFIVFEIFHAVIQPILFRK
jgi:VIT1/CCC1 family predicted Fe2+/Mn2+ transporter